MLDKPDLTVWGGALVGARSDQQDTFLTHALPASAGLLAIVADGMGGHASGALASQTAATAFRDAFLDLMDHHPLDDVLNGAVQAANDAIEDMQAGHPERTGMGTTLVAILMTASGLSWISVGDSALLLCREKTLHRLNDDHSLRSLPEFAGSKQSNMLRSALTGDEIAMIDCHAEPLALQKGDVVLLASDGLLTLSDPEIVAEVGAPGAEIPDALGRNLLRAVERKADPKQDNCTVIVAVGLAGRPVSDTRPVRAPPPADDAPAIAKPAATRRGDVGQPSHIKPVLWLLLAGAVLVGAALLALFW